jgi:glycyl-tRNA synthetase alpha subunit
MDARGVISTTERAALMARVRGLACRTAAAYLEQIGGAPQRRDMRAEVRA